MSVLKRFVCHLTGHRDVTKTFDGRGKRISVTSCGRCGRIDHDRFSVTPRNRALRRRWARDVAKELTR